VLQNALGEQGDGIIALPCRALARVSAKLLAMGSSRPSHP
jgi:hypothetical protein